MAATGHNRGDHMLTGRRAVRGIATAFRAMAMLGSLGVATEASAATKTYTKQVTLPVAPASGFLANSGGYGWAVALTSAAVYNVYHHAALTVACHKQSDGSNCWANPSKSITGASGASFLVPN